MNYTKSTTYSNQKNGHSTQKEKELNVRYNPKDVDITSRNLSLRTFIDRLEHNEIDLKAGFNRTLRWTLKQQSRFIESILIRLPIPSFYFDGSYDDNWLIIDGFQRIMTLKNYVVDNRFGLIDLEYLPQFEGLTFNDLPRDLQRRIYETIVATYIINPGTPDFVKYSIFKRINTGGVTLTAQEIRTGLYNGVVTDFISSLANLEVFEKAVDYSISDKRMEDEELITRYLSFLINDYSEYNGNIDNWLNLTMSRIKEISEAERENIKTRFVKAMETAYFIFGKKAFRIWTDDTQRRKPVSKALFETLSVLFSKLDSTQLKMLEENKEILLKDYAELTTQNKKFIKAIKRNTSSSVQYRFQSLGKLIETITQ